MSLEFNDRIAVLKFNHTDVLNAVGSRMLEDFFTAIDEINNPANGARCVLLTGEGRAFCAGANLQDEDRGERRGGSGSVLRSSYHPILLSLRDLEMPVVTAVNGAAAGVGMSFAMMGDIVCASKNAYFLQAFARIGLVPDGGSTFMLPRLVGWGVNRLFDDNEALLAGAMDIARQLANGPRSLALIRKAYWATWSNAFEAQLDLEARLQNEAGASSDFSEGVSAFLEKRDARFQGE
jgi:2-(1,2-epoxy-1,2-dihydrophenyl)acetyl-CoA isomerase